MQLQEPRQCHVSLDDGLLGNADGHYIKRFEDLSGLYADDDAFQSLVDKRGDQTAYDVTTYTPGDRTCDLIMGVTRMEPGAVGDEFFMTRGHIHANGDRPEIYYGQAGCGLMLLESPAGEIRLIEIKAQCICYVPPYWIHRSINTGSNDLVMMFTYPADSGQDYGIIERAGGMRVRIVKDGHGGWKEVDNPAWRARNEQEIADIFNDQMVNEQATRQ